MNNILFNNHVVNNDIVPTYLFDWILFLTLPMILNHSIIPCNVIDSLDKNELPISWLKQM